MYCSQIYLLALSLCHSLCQEIGNRQRRPMKTPQTHTGLLKAECFQPGLGKTNFLSLTYLASCQCITDQWPLIFIVLLWDTVSLRASVQCWNCSLQHWIHWWTLKVIKKDFWWQNGTIIRHKSSLKMQYFPQISGTWVITYFQQPKEFFLFFFRSILKVSYSMIFKYVNRFVTIICKCIHIFQCMFTCLFRKPKFLYFYNTCFSLVYIIFNIA